MRTGVPRRRVRAALTALALSGSCAFSAQPAGDRSLQSANALLQRGLYEEAAAEYQIALDQLESADKLNEARYGQALALQRAGRADEAIETLAAIAPSGEFAFRVDADVLLTTLLAQEGRYEDAAGAARRVLDHTDHPSWGSTASLHVELLHRVGEHRDAVRGFRALRRGAGGVDASRLSRAAFFAGLSASVIAEGPREHAAAGELLNMAATDTDSAQIRDQASLRAAHAWQLADDDEQAESAYRRAMQSDSPSIASRARLGLGVMQRNAGRPAEALQLLEDARSPDMGESLSRRIDYECALALVAADEPARAAGLLDNVLEQEDPELAPLAAYWRAKCALHLEEHDEAAERLEEALDRHPKSPVAPEMTYDLGYAHSRAGRSEEAAEAFSRVRSRYPKHALAEQAHVAELSLALDMGLHQRVVELGGAFLDAHPQSEHTDRARLLIAEALYSVGDHAGTVQLCDSLSDAADPELTLRAALLHGLSLHAVGRSEAAGAMLESVAARAPEDEDAAPAYFALAEIHVGAERWGDARDAAVSSLELMQDDHPDRAAAKLLLGIASARLGDLQDAAELLDEVARSDAEDEIVPHAVFELGQTRLTLGQTDDAAGALAHLVEEHPESRFVPHGLRLLGSIAAQAGDTDSADELYARAAASGDAAVADAAFVDRVRLLLSAGREGDALDVLDDAGPEAAHWRVIALSRTGRHGEALEQAASVNEADLGSDVADTYTYQLAVSEEADGDRARAEKLFRSLTESGRYGARASLHLAEMAIEQDDIAGASAILREALDAHAGRDADVCAALRYKAAWCSYRMSEPREVVAMLEDPPCESEALTGPAAMLLGEAYFELERGSDAAEQFAVAAEADLDAADAETALLRLGESHAMAQNWQDSAAVLLRLRDEFPDADRWYAAEFGVGWALENQGRHEDAIERYREVIQRHDGETAARAQFQIGECLFAVERHREAVRELLRVDILYSYPQWSAAALFEAGRCFEAMNKIGEARAQYRLVVQNHADSPWAEAASERLDAIAGPGGS